MKTNKLLLDTHVFLWWKMNDSRLKNNVRSEIASADLVFVSAASAWEAAIKVALKKLKIPESFAAGVEASGFEKLPIHFSHAEAAAALPGHHGDPFDRMLIAQAQIENLTLVSHDRQLKKYDVSILWT